jgi:CRP-like cAMP-binding protein
MTEPIEGAVLRKGRLFAEATSDDLDAILQLADEMTFEANQAIFEWDDTADGMFVVLEGEAQVEIGGRFHRLRPGDFFGEMALLVPDKRLATVRAVEPVKALRISSEAFQAFLLEHPRVAIGMLQALTARLREVEQRIDAWMGS